MFKSSEIRRKFALLPINPWHTVKEAPRAYLAKGEGEKIRQMFNRIAWRYDFLNRLFTMGLDRRWRKKAVASLGLGFEGPLLDVATGTADLALEACRQYRLQKIVGLDVSEQMLALGQKKIDKRGLTEVISLVQGPSERMPFEDGSFNGVMSGFGVRNFDNLDAGLSEMFRVLKRGGRLVILEFSQSQNPLFRNLFHLYFRHLMPLVGRLVSKDPQAYTYLPDSVYRFPSGTEFLARLEQVGFRSVGVSVCMFGLVSVYFGHRPAK